MKLTKLLLFVLVLVAIGLICQKSINFKSKEEMTYSKEFIAWSEQIITESTCFKYKKDYVSQKDKNVLTETNAVNKPKHPKSLLV